MSNRQETPESTESAAGCESGASPYYVPIAWLQEMATFYRARAEERPHEFQEYRRMAWACGVVQEIWRDWIEKQKALTKQVLARGGSAAPPKSQTQ